MDLRWRFAHIVIHLYLRTSSEHFLPQQLKNLHCGLYDFCTHYCPSGIDIICHIWLNITYIFHSKMIIHCIWLRYPRLRTAYVATYYAHSHVALCSAVVISSLLIGSHDLCTHIIQLSFTGTATWNKNELWNKYIILWMKRMHAIKFCSAAISERKYYF